MLKIDNISLRALEYSDLELLYKWENNTKIWEVSNTIVPFSKNILSKYLENQSQDIFTSKQLRLIIEFKKNPIGTIELFDYDPLNNRAGIGIWIIDSKREKGHAKKSLLLLINYSFKHLKLNQLYCNISSNNENSIKLFSKLGFVLSGTKKQWNRTQNGWQDELLFQKFCD